MRASGTWKMSSSSRSASASSNSSGPSNTGVETARRGPAIGCSIRRVSLAEIDLVEPLDAPRRVPSLAQRRWVPRLAHVRQPGFDLLLDHVAHVHLEIRLRTGETPRLGGLVRRTGFGIRERVARAGPRGIP